MAELVTAAAAAAPAAPAAAGDGAAEGPKKGKYSF